MFVSSVDLSVSIKTVVLGFIRCLPVPEYSQNVTTTAVYTASTSAAAGHRDYTSTDSSCDADISCRPFALLNDLPKLSGVSENQGGL